MSFLIGFVVTLLFSPFFLYGLWSAYKAYRFIRAPGVDWSAGFVWHEAVTWNIASQTEEMIKLFPWIAKDFSHVLGANAKVGE